MSGTTLYMKIKQILVSLWHRCKDYEYDHSTQHEVITYIAQTHDSLLLYISGAKVRQTACGQINQSNINKKHMDKMKWEIWTVVKNKANSTKRMHMGMLKAQTGQFWFLLESSIQMTK